jgi:dolichyl-diphosphooligosaccharide--protein glycosyltransferase
MYAIQEYGRVIHEFDPYFNFRATEYLERHGAQKFFQWFDYESWYPLGRPVGTTIYPGMQFTSVAIYQGLDALGMPMSLNDVCVFVPVWFGVIATLFLGLLAYETLGSVDGAVAATAIFAIIPAHIMRSVGGGYDNESVAMTAMLATFYFWTLSLRNASSWWVSVIAGVAYVYMVAAWGGFVFVLNMVGLHAAFLVIIGRFNMSLYMSYTIFYVLGTAGAMQIPVVGWAPLKSLEQLGAAGVFALIQLMGAIEMYSKSRAMSAKEKQSLTMTAFGGAAAAGAAVASLLASQGYFGPLSARVRGLFVQHTRTGNPLVDSVAEHQPASADAYFHYLHYACLVAPLGFLATFRDRTDAKYFMALFAVVAYYFSARMSRLIILIGPVASVLGGLVVGEGVAFAISTAADMLVGESKPEDAVEDAADDASKGSSSSSSSPSKKSKGSKKPKASKSSDKAGKPLSLADDPWAFIYDRFGINAFWAMLKTPTGKLLSLVFGAVFLVAVYLGGNTFYAYSHAVARGMSHPQIMYKARTHDGKDVMVDDYRQAYLWIKDNTPEDSRVMAWWDYGYQIASIANRTTIADGNTWNHEHIALLGKCLTSPEKRAHRMIRHLADYVLVWAGGGGDDLAKSPHMARIGTSVFHDICPGDPMCRHYGFIDAQRHPTPMMAKSLLYRLHGHNVVPGVSVDPNRFQEVHTTRYGKVRIFKVMSVDKESKRWLADPANRVCDAPGSWYCVGQYPPALANVVKQREAFKQLEDFNRKD